MTPVLVAAMGSEYRRDDGAGLAAARRVEERWRARAGAEGGALRVVLVHDPLDLLGRWDDADLAIVLDSTRSGAPAGTVRVMRLGRSQGERTGTAPQEPRASTHGIGVAEVYRLAVTVGSAPASVVVVGIEGSDFAQGEGLSRAVLKGVDEAAEVVLGLVTLARRRA